jgi:hypothetical protein
MSPALSATLLGLGVVAGLAFVFWLFRLQRARRQAICDMARRQGWQASFAVAGFGRPARVRLRAADGAWQVEVVQPTSQSTGGNLRQVTEFIAARPTWPGGMVIVGPALPPETASFASMLLASLDNPLGRRLVAGLVGADLADLAVGLRPVGGAAGVTALASAELPATIDLDTIAASLRGWSQIRRGEEGFPILIVSPDGVRLRLRHAITDPDGFVSFIALARGVVGYLGRPI